MDPQEKDEAKLRRQASLAQRMGEALDRLTPHGAQECPDPEIIAAYAEQSLNPAESSKWEGHFAACSRCRNILRVLAASADTPLAAKEVAQIGELVAAARPAAERPSVSADRAVAHPKVIHWPTRWLAPAIGVAAVLAVWFALRPPWRTTDQGTSATLVAQAPREEVAPPAAPPVPQQPAEIVPPQQPNAEPATPMDRSLAPAAPRNEPAESALERDLQKQKAPDISSPRAGVVGGVLQGGKKLDRLADGRQNAEAAPGPAAAPPPPPARLAMPAPAAPQSKAKSALSADAGEAPQVTASANAVENTPAAQNKPADSIQNQARSMSASAAQQVIVPQERAGARKEQAFGLVRPPQKDSSLLKAPSDLIHWRAGKGGIIQHSVDSGRTWVPQASPSKEDWLAGAAFSDTVCWLAGRHGAIARTADGQTWQRIPPPAQAAGADGSLPDWTGISASDAQSAVVTAADGRRFATADGGKTWQSQ
ncbi:MAG TPA: hypothetical protein VKT71_02735 [Candidatus Acidoferrales bacterium]|nr:hypothetical protein [Candidatus Acidoferrales bacterium]